MHEPLPNRHPDASETNLLSPEVMRPKWISLHEILDQLFTEPLPSGVLSSPALLSKSNRQRPPKKRGDDGLMKQEIPNARCSDLSSQTNHPHSSREEAGMTSLIHRFVENNEAFPHEFVLHPNHPASAQPQKTIRFGIPETSVVRLMIYNVLGQRVKVLVDGLLSAGMHEVVFETSDLPKGTYLCHLKTPDGNFVKKMILMA